MRPPANFISGRMMWRWILLFCMLVVQAGCRNPCNPSGDDFDPRNISRNSGNSYEANIALGVLGEPHAVWHDSTPGNWEILYSTESPDEFWSPPTTVSNSSSLSSDPDIAVDASGVVHVVWMEEVSIGQVFYATKPNGGVWSSPVNISNSADLATQPRIVTDNSQAAHVVWTEAPIMYSSKPPSGLWTTPQAIIPSGLGPVNPSIAVALDGGVHVISEGGSDEIFYIFKAPGDTWSQPVNVSNNPGLSFAPDVAVSPSGDVYAVWYEVFEQKAYYTVKYENDSLFQVPVEVPNVLGVPDIAIDANGCLHLIWSLDGEISYSKKPPSNDWSIPINISNTGGYSSNPDLTAGGGVQIHAIWQDLTPGNWDIFYDTPP